MIRKKKEVNKKIYEKKNISKYNHMKTLLGHIQIMENLNIVPIPIFCLCFSEDDSMFFTGDNNGVIKIWSTRTGALIDVFKKIRYILSANLIIYTYNRKTVFFR